MAEVLLIQPKAGNWEAVGVRLPEGLLTLAAVPHKEGYKVKILDLRLIKDWKKALLDELKQSPVIVALTCMTGPQIKYALEISKFIKENSNVPVVWGGVHPTLLPEQTVSNQYVDIVVIDEGEITFLDLIRTQEAGKPLDDVLGIAYKKDGKVKRNPPRPLITNLDELPDKPYELVDVNKYFGFSHEGDDPSIAISTSRGCNFKCTFCYDTVFYNNTWRAMSAEKTIGTIKNIIDKFGIRNIYIQDDNFAVSIPRFKQIVNSIIEEKLDITWGLMGIRIDTIGRLDEDFLSKIARSGCRNMDSGLESGSDQILRMIKKGFTVQQALDGNRKIGKFPIIMKYSFIGGYPTETEEDLKMSISMISQLVKDNKNACTPFLIYSAYPGVPLYELAKEYGVKEPRTMEEWSTFDYENSYLNYPWLDKKRIKMLRNLAFTSLFANPAFQYKVHKKIVKFLFKMYQPIAKFRFHNNLYQMPVEKRIADFIAASIY